MTAPIQLIEALRSARDVDALAQALEDDNRLVRRAAAEALGQIGDARTVEPLLVALRNDGWSRVREGAAEALGQIGDARAIEPLLAALRDPNQSVRVAAAAALGHLGGERAIEPLVATLQDTDWLVRKTAAAALGAINDARAIEPLLSALRDSDPSVRKAASPALGAIAGTRAIGPLLLALRDRDLSVRKAAAEALGQIGVARGVEPLLAISRADLSVTRPVDEVLASIGVPAIEYLLAALRDESASIRKDAIAVLGAIGDTRAVEPLLATLRAKLPGCEHVSDALARLGVAAVEPLLAALEDDNSAARGAAAKALGQIGEIRALEPLIVALGDRNAGVRKAAIAALGAMGDVRAIEPLLATLRADLPVCEPVDEALARMGVPAIEPLLSALQHRISAIRETAAQALGKIGDARAVEPLLSALRDIDLGVRTAAVTALGAIGDVRALEALLVALQDHNPVVREAAAKALGQIRKAQALEPLIAALRDGNASVRKAAIVALGAMGDARAIEPLLATLRADLVFSDSVAESLAMIGGPAIKPLILTLRYGNAAVREAAAKALGKIGDMRAEEPLVLSLRDSDLNVRKTVAKALEQIRQANMMLREAQSRSDATRVQLTTFHPKEIRAGTWYSLLAYVHLQRARAAVQADSNTRRNRKVPTGEISHVSGVEIARGAEISVVPELPGCRINPTDLRFLWLEDWHRADFRLQAAPDVTGFAIDTPVSGRIAFYVEGLLVGEVPIWTVISEQTALGDPEASCESPSASLFQAIFASYAHEDADVVDTLSRAYVALGNTFLRDVETLRSGETWDQRLLQLIERADVFQLYWSEAAKRSPNVEREWRHALAQARSTFMRPVYWRQPMPDPPNELACLHFAYYTLRSAELDVA